MPHRLPPNIILTPCLTHSLARHFIIGGVSCFRHLVHLYNRPIATSSSKVSAFSNSVTTLRPQGNSIAADQAMEKANETPMEAVHRQQADFPKVENDLNFKRFSSSDLGIVDRFTGLLGSRNPFSKKARADAQEVWLLDNTAYQKQTNGNQAQWEAEFVACYFQKGRKDVTKFVTYIADAIGLDGKVGVDDSTHKLIAERLQPFISNIAPAHTISISIPAYGGAPKTQTLGPSDSNGISSQIVPLGDNNSADGDTITSTNNGSEYPKCSGKTRFAGPEGWAIISDIDDTIKITQTMNPIGILRTTFAEETQTTPGMEGFYKILDQQFQNPAWFYVSASPYNLYPFLHKFIYQYYLPGTIVLRDASWMFFGGLLQSFTQGVQEYKTSRITKIHGWIPQRKIICIGDSTQKDPETYGEMYKKYPGWIKAIYIRKVTDAPFMEVKNTDKRFQDAFKDVPEHVWKLFVMPNEIADHLKQLVGEEHLGVVGALQGY